MDDMRIKLQEISVDVKEIKAIQLTIVKQQAIDSHILKEHEKRSTNLEARMKPIEADYSFRAKLQSLLLGGGGLVALLALALSVWVWLKPHL